MTENTAIPEEFYSEGMLTLAEAADLARVSTRILYFEMAAGRLRTQYLGRKRLVARGEMLRYLRELPEGENPDATENSRRAQFVRWENDMREPTWKRGAPPGLSSDPAKYPFNRGGKR